MNDRERLRKTIRDLHGVDSSHLRSERVHEIFEGETVWDSSRPDGQPKRYLDVSRARDRFGFEAQVPLDDGLRKTIASFRGLRATV